MASMRKLVFLLAWCPLLAPAATDVADPYASFQAQDDYDESLEVPWVEIETHVQKGPDEQALVELENQHLPPGMRLFADLEHLAVDPRDHVSRLWLVVRSARGADNATFEGYRCATSEYKVYAYYNPRRSKPLRVVNLPRWRAIRPASWRDELVRETLCSDTNPRDPDSVRLRPQPEAADYQSPYE